MSYKPAPLTEANPISDLFKNIVIHINGYTKIDRVVLIKLITSNGGTVCRMPRKKTTTYILTDQDNFVKDGYKVIRSSWVIDSLEQKTLLPFDYDNMDIDCKHPNFIEDYYSKSRLHFISMEKLQLRSKYLKISNLNSKNQKTKKLNRLIYYMDFDSFFVSGSIVKYNKVNKYFPIDIEKDCVLVSNGSKHSEITSLNYIAKNIVNISRHDYFETGKNKYEAYKQKNPESNMKFYCLKVEFNEYRDILTKFYDFMASKFETVIPMSIDEGMFFEFVEEGSMDYFSIMKKIKLIKLKIKQITGVSISISVTNNFLFLNKIILKRVKPDGIGVCLSNEDFTKEIENIKILEVPMSGVFMNNQLKEMLPSDVYNNEITVKELKKFIKNEFDDDYNKFFQPLIVKTGSNTLAMKFINNIFLLKDDPVLTKNKLGDKEYYTPKTVSCSINYHMNFTNLWDINVFVKRFSKYLVDRLNTLTNFYESINKIGVIVVVALEGNVVSKFGGMGNNVKRLSKSLTYDNFIKIDSNSCLSKLSADFYTLIKLLIDKDRLNDIKGISLQILKLKNNNKINISESPLNFNFKTPDNKNDNNTTLKKNRRSTHSKETLIKLIDNEDKETLKELPLDVLEDLYFQQKFDFTISRSSKRKLISTNSNSLKKLKTEKNSPVILVSDNVRTPLNKNNLNVFEPISFQAQKSISAIKILVKNWITFSISTNAAPTSDDVELFLNFLKNLRENGQQSRLDNVVIFMNNHLQLYQYENDESGVINDWERIMLLKLLPLME